MAEHGMNDGSQAPDLREAVEVRPQNQVVAVNHHNYFVPLCGPPAHSFVQLIVRDDSQLCFVVCSSGNRPAFIPRSTIFFRHTSHDSVTRGTTLIN